MKLKGLRIADIELLITAAKLESIGKSAKQHHLSQSAASAAVQRVEQALGFDLCTHERKRFRLTQEGEALLPKLEEWIRQLNDLAGTSATSPIRIITTHALAQVAIPRLLAREEIDLTFCRPDLAHRAILRGEADLALVLDNAPWEGVTAAEVGHGLFQLYASTHTPNPQPILLPEDQLEVLTLQQNWEQLFGGPLPVKARIPSWSLIADICSRTSEVGLLPDFLGKHFDLESVTWQPKPTPYRILALYQNSKERLDQLLVTLSNLFSV